jgi:glycosyltransferase involved in cell wall biosynthesis
MGARPLVEHEDTPQTALPAVGRTDTKTALAPSRHAFFTASTSSDATPPILFMTSKHKFIRHGTVIANGTMSKASCLHIADYAASFPGTFIDGLAHLGKQLEREDWGLILWLPAPRPWHDLLTGDGAEVVCVPLPSLLRPVALWKYFWRLKKTVREENVKVIHCHFNLKYLLPVKWFTGRDVQVIWHWHNMPDTKVGESRNVLKLLFRDLFYRAIDPLIDQHVAISKEIDAWLSSVSGKVSLVPNGVHLTRFDPASLNDRGSVRSRLGIRGDAALICNVANFRPQKDHVTLLKAAREVLKQKPNTYFVLVGDGPTRKQVETLARELGIAGKVIFTGTVQNVEEVVGASDVFVLSSLYEGFGLVILEAMGLEKPVVVTNVGGCPDIVKPGTGFLIDVRDFHGMAQKIMWLLDHPEKAKLMGREGRSIAENRFSLDCWSQNILALYHMESRQFDESVAEQSK